MLLPHPTTRRVVISTSWDSGVIWTWKSNATALCVAGNIAPCDTVPWQHAMQLFWLGEGGQGGGGRGEKCCKKKTEFYNLHATGHYYKICYIAHCQDPKNVLCSALFQEHAMQQCCCVLLGKFSLHNMVVRLHRKIMQHLRDKYSWFTESWE